ncbi:MAG: hypothetical protein PUB91_02615 [Bacteroidales bacterium]|nr:hypothetical protein [Bacteroidales bacterium]
MKKIFIALAMIASMQIAGAQVKSAADAQKAIDAAKAAAENPKKATKAATWMKLGDAYVAAYDAPAGNLWLNGTKQELAIVMGNEKPSSVEDVVVGGQQFTKEVYAAKDLYFNPAGQLSAIKVTKPVDPKALQKAVEAYAKAAELDPKSKAAESLASVNQKFVNEAYTEYVLGNFAAGSQLFEEAAKALKAVGQTDTLSIYNAGFLAQNAGDKERAKGFYQQCLGLGYYSDGELYAKLADVDPDNTKKYLEEGFSKFPESQSILIGLINYYMSSEESTDRLFELLDVAKKNEPDNASLYYVEGNIHTQLKDYEKAAAAYKRCAEVNPSYEFGYIGAGIMYYNLAVELQEQAQAELDDAKYMKLAADFEKTLKSCIEPFEKAFEVTKDEQIKLSVAEYLKNACYRFRDEDAKYQAAYDKYSAVVAGN